MQDLPSLVDLGFLAIGGLHLLLALYCWHRTLKHVRVRRFSTLVKMNVFAIEGAIGIGTVLLFCFVPAVLVHGMDLTHRPFLIPAGVVNGVAVMVGMLRPPVVLVLARSVDRTKELLRGINSVVMPLRVVGLFDRNLLKAGHLSWELFARQNLRTWNDNKWQEVVHELKQIVPIIIVDTRHPTEAVVEETFFAVNRNRLPASMFFCASDGSAPSLSAIGIHPGSSVFKGLLTTNDIAVLQNDLRQLLSGRKMLDPVDAIYAAMHRDSTVVPNLLSIAEAMSTNDTVKKNNACRAIAKSAAPLCQDMTAGEIERMMIDETVHVCRQIDQQKSSDTKWEVVLPAAVVAIVLLLIQLLQGAAGRVPSQ